MNRKLHLNRQFNACTLSHLRWLKAPLTSLQTGDIELAKSVMALDEDVDHFAFFILRILRDAAQNPTLANELHVDPLDCMDHQILVYRMEYAADYAADIARHIIMLNGAKQKIPDDVLAIMITTGKRGSGSFC